MVVTLNRELYLKVEANSATLLVNVWMNESTEVNYAYANLCIFKIHWVEVSQSQLQGEKVM